MSKILALDFGLKRTGVAITDDSKTFAFAYDAIDSAKLIDYLKVILPKEKVDHIVIGEPRHLDNSESSMTKNVHALKDVLSKEFPGVIISLHDERFTSKLASEALFLSGMSKKKRQDKKEIDKTSAVIILQSYLSES